MLARDEAEGSRSIDDYGLALKLPAPERLLRHTREEFTAHRHLIRHGNDDPALVTSCKRNCERNGGETAEHRLSDWAAWEETGLYEWVIGSDILYGEEMQTHLRRVFETNLAPGGRVLLSDPFRAASLGLLEALEADGWSVTLSKWSVGEEATPRPVALYELSPPSPTRGR